MVKCVIGYLKSFSKHLLLLLGLKKEDEEPEITESEAPVRIEGTEGVIDADGIIGREKDKIALVIDFEFGDIPTWVEWDVDLKQISIAQNGGAVAILKTVLSEKEAKDFESTDNLLLCTNIGEERIVHTIPLLLRSSNDNEEEEDMADFGQELAIK